MKAGPTNRQEFLALLVRRKWWILVPFAAFSGVAALLTYLLPYTFVSESVIQVVPRDVPEDYVVDLMVESSEQRLAQIKETVVSRTNIAQIVRKFESQLPELVDLNMDQKVSTLRRQIDIQFRTVTGRTQITSFQISYQNQDPALAQAITSELTTLFIQQDSANREVQVVGTTEFLMGELGQANEELAESDRELERLRREYQSSLPGQLDSNQSELDRLTGQLQTNEEAYRAAVSTLSGLEQRLAETPEFFDPEEVPTGPVDPAIREYEDALAEYERLADRYRPDHPAVETALLTVQRLREDLPPVIDTPAEDASPLVNDQYQLLKIQIEEARGDVEVIQNRRTYLEAEIERYRGYVERTFRAEPLIADAIRRNEDTRQRQVGLQRDLDEVRRSESLQLQQREGRFQILDQANLPLVPTKPDKLMVLIGGIIGSLAFAVGLAVAIDVARQKIWTQSEIEAFWGVPVLVDIPEILTDSDVAGIGRQRAAIAASSIGGGAAYIICLYVMYLNHDFLLQQLDPIIQRLVY